MFTATVRTFTRFLVLNNGSGQADVLVAFPRRRTA